MKLKIIVHIQKDGATKVTANKDIEVLIINEPVKSIDAPKVEVLNGSALRESVHDAAAYVLEQAGVTRSAAKILSII